MQRRWHFDFKGHGGQKYLKKISRKSSDNPGLGDNCVSINEKAIACKTRWLFVFKAIVFCFQRVMEAQVLREKPRGNHGNFKSVFPNFMHNSLFACRASRYSFLVRIFDRHTKGIL